MGFPVNFKKGSIKAATNKPIASNQISFFNNKLLLL